MKRHKLLIIGHVWPEPNSSAAGSRMLQIIALFKAMDYHVHFVTACSKTANAFDLHSYGVSTGEIALNHSSFDSFIADYQPDVVLFDRFMVEEQYGWRVTEHCANAIKILDTEDLHCLRKARKEALKNNEPCTEKYLFQDIAKREIASIYRCDMSLIISEAEMQILTNTFKVPVHILYYLPFLLNHKESSIQLPSYSERKHLVFIGNFLHEPNYDSVIYLKSVIWSVLSKELPNVELHIYGAYESPKVKQLHNPKERFFIKGFAKNVAAVMQEAKLLLAPLRFGAGLKGKLIDAMEHGTPAVMTAIAAEGMFGTLPPNGAIADDVAAFVTQTKALYTNEKLWNIAQQNGFTILEKRFQFTDFSAEFKNTIGYLKSNLTSHRYQNVTGMLLQHHQMQSTKFLSKYIEEKNKKN